LVEIIVEMLRVYKSLGTDQIPVEIIQVGGNTLYIEIQAINSE
jgi:hypothetical protein